MVKTFVVFYFTAILKSKIHEENTVAGVILFNANNCSKWEIFSRRKKSSFFLFFFSQNILTFFKTKQTNKKQQEKKSKQSDENIIFIA